MAEFPVNVEGELTHHMLLERVRELQHQLTEEQLSHVKVGSNKDGSNTSKGHSMGQEGSSYTPENSNELYSFSLKGHRPNEGLITTNVACSPLSLSDSGTANSSYDSHRLTKDAMESNIEIDDTESISTENSFHSAFDLEHKYHHGNKHRKRDSSFACLSDSHASGISVEDTHTCTNTHNHRQDTNSQVLLPMGSIRSRQEEQTRLYTQMQWHNFMTSNASGGEEECLVSVNQLQLVYYKRLWTVFSSLSKSALGFGVCPKSGGTCTLACVCLYAIPLIRRDGTKNKIWSRVFLRLGLKAKIPTETEENEGNKKHILSPEDAFTDIYLISNQQARREKSDTWLDREMLFIGDDRWTGDRLFLGFLPALPGIEITGFYFVAGDTTDFDRPTPPNTLYTCPPTSFIVTVRDGVVAEGDKVSTLGIRIQLDFNGCGESASPYTLHFMSATDGTWLEKTFDEETNTVCIPTHRSMVFVIRSSDGNYWKATGGTNFYVPFSGSYTVQSNGQIDENLLMATETEQSEEEHLKLLQSVQNHLQHEMQLPLLQRITP